MQWFSKICAHQLTDERNHHKRGWHALPFLALVVLNMAVFGYYSFLRKPTESQSVSQARAALVHPVTATDVSNELPPMIGTKK